MVERERDRRKRLWDELISKGGPYSISAQLLRELGIFGGAQGIWANKSVTGFVTTDGHGVTVSLLHRGAIYPDDLFESGVLYHIRALIVHRLAIYQKFKATKNASKLSLPVFVIT